MFTDPSQAQTITSVSADETTDPANDPIFAAEQQHLDEVYGALQTMQAVLVDKMEKVRREAEADKKALTEDISNNFEGYSEAFETYADYAVVNSAIDAYNTSQAVNAERLADVTTLLRQPYFAKVELQYKPGAAAKELYIGNAGMSDENYRRLVVDWRSPVAETYYNQENGRTSYKANGRTIEVDLKLRRQFDITKNKLAAYFDTTVAIQDAMLLASLSQERTSQMKAITATIQKEQNQVIRHEDVPVLLVNGIAGSGKTSVLMQRIAYLFYQQRESLKPEEVFLITPNPVFSRYIENVLPDLGERNPETMTFNEFMARIMPADRSRGRADIPVESLRRIDEAVRTLTLDQNDFKDIVCDGVQLISAGQIRQVADKYKRIPAGPHLITLMREELHKRLVSRLKQMASTERSQNEMHALSIQEQVRIFHETADPHNENEVREFTLAYLNDRFAHAFDIVERDEWLRMDRIGMRLLGTDGLLPVEWVYLKMACTGMSDSDAKFVMIDEVQDYTAAQLAVMRRYFRRAHFLLLGDENQAIKDHTSTFDEIRAVFESDGEEVQECRLMTSYRSSPQITSLFSRLMPHEEQMRVSSIQRDDAAPELISCEVREDYEAQLKRVVREASAQIAEQQRGLAAVIAADRKAARRIAALLEDEKPILIDDQATLPPRGVMVMTLDFAKGLEFDHVIIPDAREQVFDDTRLGRNRLYTAISRATNRITILAPGVITPLLDA